MIRPALAKPIVFWLPSVCFRMMFDFEQGNMPNNHTNNGWGAFPKNGLESNGRQAWHLTQGFFFRVPSVFCFCDEGTPNDRGKSRWPNWK